MDCKKPKYNPKLWNNIDDKSKKYTNCYSYAMNRIEGNRTNKLQPGFLSNSKYSNYTCEEISQKIINDNPSIKRSSKYDETPCGYYKIVLLIDNIDKKDYHFYRQDINGNWSHKLGPNNVSNLDASGNILNNIELNNHNYDNFNYNIFCGYFLIPYKEISYY